MRALVALLLSLWLAPAWAQVPMTGAGNGTPGALPTWDGFTSGGNDSCGFVTTCNISSVTVPVGFIVVGVRVTNSSAVTAVSVCGTSLTLVAVGAPPTYDGGIAYGTTAGGTCTVAISGNPTSVQRAAFALGRLSNLNSTTPGTACSASYAGINTGGTYACTGGLTVSADGFGITMIATNQATAITSSNATIDAQYNGTGQSVAIAHTTTSNTPSFSTGNFYQVSVEGFPWR